MCRNFYDEALKEVQCLRLFTEHITALDLNNTGYVRKQLIINSCNYIEEL